MTGLLSCRNLGRDFGGLHAVQGLDLDVQAGQILGIIGPNGAGKTTLFNLLSGFLKPSAGSIRFDGTDTAGVRPHRLNRLGLARTFQLVRPFPKLTVLQNVVLGAVRPGDEGPAVTRRLDGVSGHRVRPAVPDDEVRGEVGGRPALTARGGVRAELREEVGEGAPLAVDQGPGIRAH